MNVRGQRDLVNRLGRSVRQQEQAQRAQDVRPVEIVAAPTLRYA